MCESVLQVIDIILKESFMKLWSLLGLAYLPLHLSAFAEAPPPPPLTASHSILVDVTTNTVLHESRADELMAPSSMTKIMTAAMIMDGLKSGKLKSDQMFTVSEKAWKAEGSRMFLEVGTSVKLEDLLKGIIIVSANDACITVGEGLSGDEGAFAQDMTHKAHLIGAKNTTFKNASGLPESGHLTTARDLVTIATYVMTSFPEYYPLFKELEFTYNTIKQGNRNPLLYKNMGCDGLKTGHAKEAGYGLVASAVQPQGLEQDAAPRRLLLVINGTPSMNARSKDAESLMAWGFREFQSPRIVKANVPMDAAALWMGDVDSVPVGVQKDLYVTLPRMDAKNLKVELKYSSPLKAPLKAGQQIGEIHITSPNGTPKIVPLVALSEVEKAGFFRRIKLSLSHLLGGK